MFFIIDLKRLKIDFIKEIMKKNKLLVVLLKL
jgi:hypothetical protein